MVVIICYFVCGLGKPSIFPVADACGWFTIRREGATAFCLAADAFKDY